MAEGVIEVIETETVEAFYCQARPLTLPLWILGMPHNLYIDDNHLGKRRGKRPRESLRRAILRDDLILAWVWVFAAAL